MEAVTKTHEGYYPTTIWSEVDRTSSCIAEVAVAALGRLLERYSRPLKAHLQSKFRVDEEQTSDWLQEFIERKVLLGELLLKASRDRGRFRTFLLNALDNFIVSLLRRENAQRRRPEGGIESMDLHPWDMGEGPTCDNGDPYALEWGRAVLAETIKRMQADCEAKQCPERWGVFKARLLDPTMDGTDAPGYEVLTARLGFRSPGEASNSLMTAKRQFDRILRQVVAEYAGDDPDVEVELRELKRAVSAG